MSVAREHGTPLRAVAAVGLLIGTAIHASIGGFDRVLQILFLLSALGMLAGAVLLFVRPRLGWVVGGGVAALTAIGYILRSTVGLPPLIPSPQPFWGSTLGGVSVIVEVLVALLAVYALSDRAARPADRVH